MFFSVMSLSRKANVKKNIYARKLNCLGEFLTFFVLSFCEYNIICKNLIMWRQKFEKSICYEGRNHCRRKSTWSWNSNEIFFSALHIRINFQIQTWNAWYIEHVMLYRSVQIFKILKKYFGIKSKLDMQISFAFFLFFGHIVN